MPAARQLLSPPSFGLLGIEPVRAALEYARMRLMRRDRLPAGDGHPIVFFPGLGAAPRYMRPLIKHCEALGYACYDWGRGRNIGPQGDITPWLATLADDVQALVDHHAQTVTLIGWSLGGLYAREIAKVVPQRIRQVVTIGSPSSRIADSTNAGWLFRLFGGRELRLPRRVTRSLAVAPRVPTTSIYSRSDGVVAWQACRSVAAPGVENIEVDSSHLGLVWHPDVLRIIADRLAQRDGRWLPWKAESGAERARGTRNRMGPHGMSS